jgi:hypothetical protein
MKRPLNIQNHKEQKELIDTIVKKMREICVIDKYVYNYGHNWKERYIRAKILNETISNGLSCEVDGKLNFYTSEDDWEIYYNFFTYHVLPKIKYKIRMDASIEHIHFLEDIIGIDKTLLLLKAFAEKNRVVAMILDNYISSEIFLSAELRPKTKEGEK